MAQRGFIYESVGRPNGSRRPDSVDAAKAAPQRCGIFDTELPIDEALPRADRGAARPPCRRAGRAAGRRQDHARAAGAARRALGGGQENPGAGAAPARRARRGRAHGGDAWREGRRHGRPARALRLEGVAQDPHRGGHRRHLHAADPRRSVARRRRRGAVRRIPRALARCRSRPGAGARRAAGPARRSQAAGDVGDARRRAGGEASGRCAGDRKRGPRLSGRDALSRPRSARADRAAGGRRGGAGAARRAGLGAGVPAGRRRKSAAPRRCSRSASAIPRSTS